MVVLFWTFVYDMLIYYKTWIYQCLIKQVKRASICSRTPNSVPIRQSGRAGKRGMTVGAHNLAKNLCLGVGYLVVLM